MMSFLLSVLKIFCSNKIFEGIIQKFPLYLSRLDLVPPISIIIKSKSFISYGR